MTWDNIEPLEWFKSKHTEALANRPIQAILFYEDKILIDRGVACRQLYGTECLVIRKVDEHEF